MAACEWNTRSGLCFLLYYVRKVSEEAEIAQDYHKLHFRVDAWTGKLASGEVQGGKTSLSDILKRLNAREYNAAAVTQAL